MRLEKKCLLPRVVHAAAAAVLALLPLGAVRAGDPPVEPAAPTGLPLPPAPTPTPAAKPWYEEISVNGFVSASTSYNLNRPASGTNQLRVFDFDDDTFKVDVAELVIQKAVGKPGEAGFRVDAVAGASVPRVSASAGLFQGHDFDLQQAWVSWIAPLGRGLRLDAGKFVTHFSYEYIEGYDAFNDNVTHSFSFGYAIPFTHTGLRATYSFSDRLAALLMLCNGWDVVKDNNGGKSVGAQLTWTPSAAVTVAANFMTGPERTGVTGDTRTVFDVVAQWKPTGSTILGLNPTYGTERGAVTPGETAVWWGVAGYARLGLSGSVALCLRAEYFDDRDGARTGTPQKLKELTLTPELKLTPHLVFRGDLRIDLSDQRVFEENTDGYRKQQATLILNALYYF